MLFFQIQHMNENEASGLKSRVFLSFLLSNGELTACLKENGKWKDTSLHSVQTHCGNKRACLSFHSEMLGFMAILHAL